MDDRKHPAQSTADGEKGWPPGVRPISQDGLGHLGVSDDGTLYWDGRPVEVRRSFSLTWWQTVGAALVTIAAVVSAAAAVVSAWADVCPVSS